MSACMSLTMTWQENSSNPYSMISHHYSIRVLSRVTARFVLTHQDGSHKAWLAARLFGQSLNRDLLVVGGAGFTPGPIPW